MLTSRMEAVGRKRTFCEYIFALLNSGVCGYVIYIKQNQLAEQQGKDVHFNKWCWVCRMAIWKKVNFDPYLKPYAKFSSIHLADLNGKAKSRKLLSSGQVTQLVRTSS